MTSIGWGGVAAEHLDPYHVAQEPFDRVARCIPELGVSLVELLERRDRLITIEFPVQTSDGTVQTFGHGCDAGARHLAVRRRWDRPMAVCPTNNTTDAVGGSLPVHFGAWRKCR